MRAASDESSKHDADKYAAPWLDAAIRMFGKATAYAEAIEVDLAHVTRMRSGEKPTPIRALLPFLGNPEAVLAFVGPMLESIGYHALSKNVPTVEEIKADVLAFVRGEPLLWKLYVAQAEKVQGWTPEEIEAALARGAK